MTRRMPDPWRHIPYHSQWETAALADEYSSARRRHLDDPNWAASGASTRIEYAEWANHICGMACLEMILAARTSTLHRSHDLLRLALDYGAYVLEPRASAG